MLDPNLRLRRQILALVSFLGLALSGCGKAPQAAKSNSYDQYENITSPSEEVTPDPEYIEFKKLQSENHIPTEPTDPERERPSYLPIYEGKPNTGSSQNIPEETEAKIAPPVDPTKFKDFPLPPVEPPRPRSSPTPPAPPQPTPTSPPAPTVDGKPVVSTSPYQALGIYTNGRCRRVSPLPRRGVGFEHEPAFRKVQWTSDDLLSVIMFAGLYVDRTYKKSLLINSISKENGGPLPDHASHENCLDADITWLRDKQQSPQDLIVGGRLDPNFLVAANYNLLSRIYKSGRVDRIFVNRVIKYALCDYSRNVKRLANDPLQSVIAIESGHVNHFHLRIKCPDNSKGVCKPFPSYNVEPTICPSDSSPRRT